MAINRRSVVLVGAPDSGKTNYLARLWAAVKDGAGMLRAKDLPQDIRYVDRALGYLLEGQFAPRTERSEEVDRSFSVVLERSVSREPVEIVVPDVSGEIWRQAVESYELPSEWMRRLRESSGALLSVRVGSDQNVPGLDWVASKRLLNSDVGRDSGGELPTAVQLCELMRFLEGEMGRAEGARRRRVAVLVTAWDLLNEEEAEAGPTGWLEREFPLFAGRILDVDGLDVAVFGVSVVGGDFADPEFRERFLAGDGIKRHGCVVRDRGGEIEQTSDLTMPVEWVLSSADGQ